MFKVNIENNRTNVNDVKKSYKYVSYLKNLILSVFL